LSWVSWGIPPHATGKVRHAFTIQEAGGGTGGHGGHGRLGTRRRDPGIGCRHVAVFNVDDDRPGKLVGGGDLRLGLLDHAVGGNGNRNGHLVWGRVLGDDTTGGFRFDPRALPRHGHRRQLVEFSDGQLTGARGARSDRAPLSRSAPSHRLGALRCAGR
jgi:hypothetical protein